VKYVWINGNRDQYTVVRMCRVLQVSRTGYSQWCVRPLSKTKIENAVLDAKVATIHEGSGRSYGRPRIVKSLENQGHPVSAERVRKSLKRQGLRPVYKRPYRVTTDSNHKKWVADITYIATNEGWLYLAVIMDLASRKIVGWSIKSRMTQDLVCDALASAYWARKPKPGLIMHTDRGSQYASDAYRRLIGDYKMVQSMSRKGNCWDNGAMESFFKSLKVERVYQTRY
jgi:putative transposase